MFFIYAVSLISEAFCFLIFCIAKYISNAVRHISIDEVKYRVAMGNISIGLAEQVRISTNDISNLDQYKHPSIFTRASTDKSTRVFFMLLCN